MSKNRVFPRVLPKFRVFWGSKLSKTVQFLWLKNGQAVRVTSQPKWSSFYFRMMPTVSWSGRLKKFQGLGIPLR